MSKDKLKVGDFVYPTLPGVMEIGDPCYVVEKIEGDMHTIVQTIKHYKSTLVVPSSKLRRL